MQFVCVLRGRFIAITGSVGITIITIATDHMAAAAAIAEMATAIAVKAVSQGGLR